MKFKNCVATIKQWLKKRTEKRKSFRNTRGPQELKKAKKGFNVAYVLDVPDNFTVKTIYVVGENNFYWMLALLCPCGCGSLIQLNLLKEARPRWSFKINSKGEISISPSIWRLNGCKSHFFIKKGRVIWSGIN